MIRAPPAPVATTLAGATHLDGPTAVVSVETRPRATSAGVDRATTGHGAMTGAPPEAGPV